MPSTEIITIPVPYDNYAYCIACGMDAAVVDAADAGPVLDCLAERHLTLRMILSTHHHGDHTGGNAALRKKTGCRIIGGDRRIAGLNCLVKDGETVNEGPFSFEALAVPGHTAGCTAFYFKELSALFTGDTLFFAGCGRIFEGSAMQLFHSLQKICALPPDTKIYCGHEYTLGNLQFAKSVEPDNRAIDERTVSTRVLLDNGLFPGPSTIRQELDTNPFLRVGEKTIRTVVLLPDAPPEAVFAELRKRKDLF
jgi:hydroxyacylglutathione hydrolase